jgi:integrase
MPVAAMHRRSIAESLATVTPVLVTDQRGRPEDDDLRAALYAWAFNKSRREAGAPPSDIADVLRWVADNSVGLADLAQDPALLRRALDTVALRRDGTAAAPTTVARKRAVLSGCLKYAVELGRLDSHPLDRISWRPPKRSDEVDRRVVVNPVQARALLTAVGKIAPDFTAFFGCMYYSALRPEETLHLTGEQTQLPTEEGCWGWLQLDGATVVPGPEWTDDGNRSEDRGLKHRARSATRRVPVPPPLVELLRSHVDTYRVGPTDRLFVNRRGPGGRYLLLRVTRCRAAPTAGCGRRPERQLSAGCSSASPWPRCRTTCGTRRCPCGSTRVCRHRRWRSGLGTA